jgi:hypothetical protein
VWADGYYLPTSTGDDVIQKHVCVVDRAKMLAGLPATEQCVVVNDVNFLNTADLDGTTLPPAGAPNLVLATGGSQLHGVLDDDAIYVWKMHVDWQRPANTTLTGPATIDVTPYRYLCGGQLTNCVPQPGVERRLDAQGDKLMARLVYRQIGPRASLVAVHSVDTAAGGGGVRWYEFRLNAGGDPELYQQGTYAPDGAYRWMASPAIDRLGNISMGYSSAACLPQWIARASPTIRRQPRFARRCRRGEARRPPHGGKTSRPRWTRWTTARSGHVATTQRALCYSTRTPPCACRAARQRSQRRPPACAARCGRSRAPNARPRCRRG